jgi:hypothetical protein
MAILKALPILVLAASTLAGAAQPEPTPPFFRFEPDEFWLNLHHFLYVLGRAEAKLTDASRQAVAGAPADAERGLAQLSDSERASLRQAVIAYASGLSLKDAVFDDPLPTVTGTLARVGDAATLTGSGIDPALSATLERVAPIYRRTWWPAHQAGNRSWRSSTSALVDRHGRTILAFITKAYGMQWPAEGYPVHLSAYANWAGAYSTRGNLLVVATTAGTGTEGLDGLETVFHEAMHQWDDQIETVLRNVARTPNKVVPRDLSHAMIFFTAGEAVRRVAPEHVPYADAYGIWQRGLRPFKEPLQEVWKPYLDGLGTRDEALAALVARTGSATGR